MRSSLPGGTPLQAPHGPELTPVRLTRRYLGTIIAVFLILLLWGYPRAAMYLNPAPPREALERVTGVVLRADRDHPHLRIRTDAGVELELDFPGEFQFIYFGRWPQFVHPRASELHRLTGCRADLQIDRLRFVLVPTNPRVWSVSCPRFSLRYEEMSSHYEREIGLQLEEYYLLLVAAALVFAANAKDRKRSIR